MTKRTIIILLLTVIHCSLFSQSINDDKISLSNFIKRMYENSPFDGVKLIEDYNQQYLVSVISLNKAKFNNDIITMSKVSKLKAQNQLNIFLNGSQISSETVIRTTQNQTDSVANTITIEQIKENATGFVNEIELLYNFDYQSNQLVFIYLKPIKKSTK